MERNEYRAVIKFFVLEGLSATEIHTKMVQVLKDSAPSFPTVHRWTLMFQRGRTSIEDDPRSRRPKSSTTSEIIQQIHNMVLDNRRVKVREIADAVGVSIERVNHILHEELKMKKLCARWVPHLLTVDDKRIRMRASQASLDRFKKNKTDFVRRFISTFRLPSIPTSEKIPLWKAFLVQSRSN